MEWHIIGEFKDSEFVLRINGAIVELKKHGFGSIGWSNDFIEISHCENYQMIRFAKSYIRYFTKRGDFELKLDKDYKSITHCYGMVQYYVFDYKYLDTLAPVNEFNNFDIDCNNYMDFYLKYEDGVYAEVLFLHFIDRDKYITIGCFIYNSKTMCMCASMPTKISLTYSYGYISIRIYSDGMCRTIESWMPPQKHTKPALRE
jgi:hypothetical protein